MSPISMVKTRRKIGNLIFCGNFLRSSFSLYHVIFIYEREIYFSTCNANEMQIGLKSIVFPALYDKDLTREPF